MHGVGSENVPWISFADAIFRLGAASCADGPKKVQKKGEKSLVFPPVFGPQNGADFPGTKRGPLK